MGEGRRDLPLPGPSGGRRGPSHPPLKTTGNFANLHWYLLFLTPFLLLRTPHSRRGMVLLLGVGLLISLTEILSAAFLPLALVGLRDRRLWPARAGLAVGLAAQALATLGSPRTENTNEPVGVVSIVLGWFANGSGTIVLGPDAQLGSVVADFGPTPLILTSLPFIAAFVHVMWRGAARHRLMAVTLLVSSMVIWAAILLVNPTPFFAYSDFVDEAWRIVLPSRYAVIVSMLVLALIPLVLAVLPRSATTARTATATVLITLHLITLFPSESARRNGPDWGVGIERAEAECAGRGPGARAELPIAPVGWFADRVSVPCTSL